MMIVKYIPSDMATGRLQERYRTSREAMSGSIGREVRGDQKWLMATSLQLDVADAWFALRALCIEKAGVDPRELELMLVRVVYLYKCRYVAANHGLILAHVGNYTKEQVIQYAHDWEDSDLSSRDKALLRFADKVALRSHEVDRSDVEAVLALGFSEEQAVAMVYMISWMVTNAIVLNGLIGPELDDFAQEMLDIVDWD
jgi:alkylhydroperoxidase family enzyme